MGSFWGFPAHPPCLSRLRSLGNAAPYSVLSSFSYCSGQNIPQVRAGMSLNIWEPWWASLRKAGYGELQTEIGDWQPCLRTGRDPGVEKEAKVDRKAKKYRDQNRVIKRKSINTFPRVSELRMCAWGSWRLLVWANSHCRARLVLRWSHSAPSWVAWVWRMQSCPPSCVSTGSIF